MRSRRLRAAGLLAALGIVVGLAAGAVQARPDRDTGAAASQIAGNIVLAHWASSPVETALLKQVIRDFERRYPRINVTRRALDPYPSSMLAQFAARKPPDVFYVDSNVFPDWAKQGVLEPLDPFISRYKFRTTPFYPRLLDAFRYRGRIYGFPKDWSPLAMQINTEMLRRSASAAPRTWSQLQTVARRMIARDAVPGGKPICIAPDWARLLAFVYQNGGSFLNASKTRPTVTSPAVRQAVNFYVNLVRAGVQLAATPAQLGVDWCGEALGKRKAAIIFEGNWVVPYLAQSFPDVRWANYPMVRNRQEGNLAFTVSYSIAKDSKKKSAAWTLLTYLAGRRGMQTWTSRGLALPSRRDVRPVGGRQAFLRAAPVARPWQFAPGFAKVMTVAGNELGAVFEGKTDVNGMLQKIQAEAARALRRANR